MGEHVLARPIGPTYVPGTLQGQSSANAPVTQAPPQQAGVTAPSTAVPMPAQAQAPNPQAPNPAQDPRSKFWRGAAQAAPNRVPQIQGAISPAGAIGTAQNTGLRRYSMDKTSG